MDRPVRELNLELGRPDAAEALRRLAAEVEAARKMGTPAMKLVHGYGSSGKGGRIRTASRNICWPSRRRGASPLWCRGNGLPSSMRPPAGPCSSIPICGRTGIWSGRTWA